MGDSQEETANEEDAAAEESKEAGDGEFDWAAFERDDDEDDGGEFDWDAFGGGEDEDKPDSTEAEDKPEETPEPAPAPVQSSAQGESEQEMRERLKALQRKIQMEHGLPLTDEAAPASTEASETPEVSPPWEKVWDEGQNAFYYHNTETDATQWEVPQQVA